MGELNTDNLESPQQATQPLAPGQSELALGKVESVKPWGKRGVRVSGEMGVKEGEMGENEGEKSIDYNVIKKDW